MAESAGLTEYWSHWLKRVDDRLESFLPTGICEQAALLEAMRYVTLGSGKRFRAALVYATGRSLGAPLDQLDIAACSVELIHAFSLIHDDLPAMDDDDFRRGRPSCHIAFGEATAILAGDALQSLAFEILSGQHNAYTPQTQLLMVKILAQATGALGMAGGQALDLSVTGSKTSLDILEKMHAMKTGALIVAAVKLGALATGSTDAKLLASLECYGKALGLAFQITDDVLDGTSDSLTLGKMLGSDEKNRKPTYLTMIGEEQGRKSAKHYGGLAKEALKDLKFDTTTLETLADFVTNRQR